MKLDITNAECIKPQYNITNTTYFNICDGTQSVVKVGTGDILSGGLVLVLVLLVCWLVFKIDAEI